MHDFFFSFLYCDACVSGSKAVRIEGAYPRPPRVTNASFSGRLVQVASAHHLRLL